MRRLPNYVAVTLDQDATIMKLECSLLNVEVNTNEYIGKNWFNSFVEYADRDKILKVFNDLFEGKNNSITYIYDIRCGENHKLIDFDYEIVIENGKKLLYSTGIEHFQK